MSSILPSSPTVPRPGVILEHVDYALGIGDLLVRRGKGAVDDLCLRWMDSDLADEAGAPIAQTVRFQALEVAEVDIDDADRLHIDGPRRRQAQRLGHQVGFDDLHAQLESYLANPARGFAEALAITPKSMNQLLDRYRKQGHFGVETIAYGEVEAPTPTTRCLTDQERDFEMAISLTTHNPKLSRELLTHLDGDATAARLVALSDTMPTDESDQALRLLREAG